MFIQLIITQVAVRKKKGSKKGKRSSHGLVHSVYSELQNKCSFSKAKHLKSVFRYMNPNSTLHIASTLQRPIQNPNKLTPSVHQSHNQERNSYKIKNR